MFDNQATRSKCEFDYTSEFASTTTIICTILILFFTIVLELTVHGTLSCCSTIRDDPDDAFETDADTASHEALLPSVIAEQPQPQLQAIPEVNAPQPSTADKDVQGAKMQSEVMQCHPHPSPNVRANRFIAAVILYALVLTAFILRIQDINNPYVRPMCRPYVGKWKGTGGIPDPNWWAVVLLNILPFIAASFSLIRTVVDCLLVRWRQVLSYDAPIGDEAWRMWPPCMPFFIVFVAIFVLIDGLFGWPVAWLMGRPRSSIWSTPRNESGRREDIEMQGEETRRLVDSVDGEGTEDEERTDGPPAYDEAVTQTRVEVKVRKEA